MCRYKRRLVLANHLAAIMQPPLHQRVANLYTDLMHKHALVQEGRNVCICMHAKLIYAMQTTAPRYRIVHESYPPALSLNILFCPHFSLEQPSISLPLVHGGIIKMSTQQNRNGMNLYSIVSHALP